MSNFIVLILLPVHGWRNVQCFPPSLCGSFFFFAHRIFFVPSFSFLRSTIFKPPSPALCTGHCALVCCKDHPPSFCCLNVCRHKSLDYAFFFFCTLQGQRSVLPPNMHLHLSTSLSVDLYVPLLVSSLCEYKCSLECVLLIPQTS